MICRTRVPLLLMSLCLTSSLSAQVVRGKLERYNPTLGGRTALGYALVALCSGDSVVTVGVSSYDGLFRFDRVNAGDYTMYVWRTTNPTTGQSPTTGNEAVDAFYNQFWRVAGTDFGRTLGIPRMLRTVVQNEVRRLETTDVHAYQYDVSVPEGQDYTDLRPILAEFADIGLTEDTALSSGLATLTGTHSLPAHAPVWLLLHNVRGKLVLHQPKISTTEDGQWTCEDVNLRKGTDEVMTILVPNRNQAEALERRPDGYLFDHWEDLPSSTMKMDYVRVIVQ